MALSLEIESTDRVSYLARESLSIEQDASSYAATASFELIDVDSSLSISELDEVLIEDGSEVLFHGEIATIEPQVIVINDTDALRLVITCRDDHIELEQRTIEYAIWDDLASSDIEMIDDLFDAYYASGIDYATYVTGTPLEPAMTEMVLEGVSLREGLSRIAERSGGQFYVHYESGTLYFHYFDSESNTAAFHLTDDSPDYSSSYPYNEILVNRDASELVNAVYIVGKETSKWVTDATSISAYGRREAGISNPDLLTEDAVDDYGATFIAAHKDPKVSYTVTTPYGSGLRAGMQIRVVCTPKSLDSTLNINRLSIYYVGDTPYWRLELGDTVPDFISSERSLDDSLTEVGTQVRVVQEEVFDTDAPAAPSFTSGNLSSGVSEDADGHQNVYITVTWGSVADADLDHYDIQISTASDFSTFVDSRSHPADGDRIERFTGLLGNTTYYVRVRSVDWVGNYSSWVTQSTTSTTDSTAPADPTGLSVSGAPTTIHVIWNQNSEADLAHYVVERAPDSGGSPGAWSVVSTQRSTFFIDDTLTETQVEDEDPFWYRVKAVDTSGNASGYATSASSTAAGQLQTGHFADDVITARLVGANEIIANTANIQDGLIVNGHIATGTIEADRMNVGTLSAISADMGTLTAGEIRVGTGTVGSDFTGFRIFSSYIAGYASNTAQFYVASSDGKAYCSGGSISFDATGMHIATNAGDEYDENKSITFEESGTVRAVIGHSIYSSETYNRLWIVCDEKTGYTSRIVFQANPATGEDGEMAWYIGDANIQFEDNGASQPIWYAPTGLLMCNGDLGNSKMTIGLTINQAENDDEILTLKSTDVAHGMTDYAETDTYGAFSKLSTVSGGLLVRGYKDADGAAGHAIYLQGMLGEAADTTKSTAGLGIVHVDAEVASGAGITGPGSNANLFAVSGGGSTQFIVDREGDLHRNGGEATFHAENDIEVLRELDDLLAQGRGVRVAGQTRAEALGIAHVDERAVMISTQKHDALVRGTLLQMDNRIRQLEEAINGI